MIDLEHLAAFIAGSSGRAYVCGSRAELAAWFRGFAIWAGEP